MPERPNEAAIRRLAGAILAERTEDWTVQRARSMRLPSWGPGRQSGNRTARLPQLPGRQRTGARRPRISGRRLRRRPRWSRAEPCAPSAAPSLPLPVPRCHACRRDRRAGRLQDIRKPRRTHMAGRTLPGAGFPLSSAGWRPGPQPGPDRASGGPWCRPAECDGAVKATVAPAGPRKRPNADPPCDGHDGGLPAVAPGNLHASSPHRLAWCAITVAASKSALRKPPSPARAIRPAILRPPDCSRRGARPARGPAPRAGSPRAGRCDPARCPAGGCRHSPGGGIVAIPRPAAHARAPCDPAACRAVLPGQRGWPGRRSPARKFRQPAPLALAGGTGLPPGMARGTPCSDGPMSSAASRTALRAPGRARILRADTGVQPTGPDQPMRSSRTTHTASRRRVKAGIASSTARTRRVSIRTSAAPPRPGRGGSRCDRGPASSPVVQMVPIVQARSRKAMSASGSLPICARFTACRCRQACRPRNSRAKRRCR